MVALSLGLAACDKVPLVQVNAAFTRADAVWFEAEQTLFVFYRFEADQGIEPISVVELTWRTDTAVQPWQPLVAFAPVHTHLPVNCGARTRCGSYSVKLDQVPREVGVRLRYHPQGSLAFETSISPFVVNSGPAWTSRSLAVYGVFDGSNTHVQWRVRHQFPNLRNEEVEGFGLRRSLRITDAHSGAVPPASADNLYWYAELGCDGVMLGWPERSTLERAVFEPTELPVSTSNDPTVCATSTVTDATGQDFAAIAVARKNPEVRPAFPGLHSPVKTAVQVPFLLKPCDRTISDTHLAMQRQRLLLSGEQVVCLDNWQDPGFATSLATTFRTAVDLARTSGNDLVLTIALHHDDTSGLLVQAVAEALATTLTPERDKASPRAVGAFVFDSFGQKITRNDVRQLVLWCPSLIATDLDLVPATSERDCAVIADNPDVVLGPFKFNSLPILPSRAQYQTFIDKYSEGQTGQMKTLQFLAPELSAVSVNVPLGTFGVATFFNNEVITPAPQDALSYCAPLMPGASSLFVFRVAAVPMPFPLSELPGLHQQMPQPAYALGLAWDSPFLLRLSYEVVLAGQVSAFSLSAPFGFRGVSQRYFANTLWQQTDFDLRTVLTQCTRFCDAPTFDSGGVYNVLQPWRQTYQQGCYDPAFPTLADAGVPVDP